MTRMLVLRDPFADPGKLGQVLTLSRECSRFPTSIENDATDKQLYEEHLEIFKLIARLHESAA